jgi:hypothetical protein
VGPLYAMAVRSVSGRFHRSRGGQLLNDGQFSFRFGRGVGGHDFLFAA